MLKSDLQDRMVECSKHLPAPKVRDAVGKMFHLLAQGLDEDVTIEIREFGTLKTKEDKPRISRNPKTGEKVHVGSRRKVAWKMSKDIKRQLNTV